MRRFANIGKTDGTIERLRAWASMWDKNRELEACPRVPVELLLKWSDPVEIITRLPKEIVLGPMDWTLIAPTMRFWSNPDTDRVMLEWMEAPLIVPQGQFITWS